MENNNDSHQNPLISDLVMLSDSQKHLQYFFVHIVSILGCYEDMTIPKLCDPEFFRLESFSR